MNYKKIYDTIIELGKLRGLDRSQLDFYSEKHHIIPKCLGGSNDDDNLVLLSAREHFVAHQLLVKLHPNNFKLIRACHAMCIDKNGNRLNNREYEWCREKFSNAQSQLMKGRNKHNNEAMARMSKKLTGRTKDTHEYLANMARKMKGRTKHTHPYLKEAGQKISLRHKGKTKFDNPNLASKYKGCTKFDTPHLAVAGKKISKTLKGRSKQTHEYIARTAEKLRGRTKENDKAQLMKSLNSLRLNEKECEMIKNLSNEGMLIIEIYEYFKGYISYSTLQKYAQKMKLNNNTKVVGNDKIENYILQYVNEENITNKQIHEKLKECHNVNISVSSIQRISRKIKLENKING